EVRVRLWNGLLYLLWIGYVERQRQYRVSELLIQVGDVGKFTRGRRNVVSAFQSGFRPDAAEAPGGAGDKPGLLHIDSPRNGQCLIHSVLCIAHGCEVGEEVGAGWAPAQLFPGLRAGGRGVSPREEPEKAKMLPGLFLRDGNHGYIQAAADGGGDTFE